MDRLSWTRAWRLMAEHAERARSPLSVEVACDACADALHGREVGVTLVPTPGVRELACPSGRRSGLLEDIELAAGEGPCSDAYRGRQPVLVPDLEAEYGRWPGFAGAARAAGTRSVFAFPVLVGDLRLGALCALGDRPGPLSAAEAAGAEAFAHIVALLAVHAHEDPSLLANQPDTPPPHGYPPEVHQATGVMAARLGIDVDEARDRMRAHAYTHGRPLSEVARGIIEQGGEPD